MENFNRVIQLAATAESVYNALTQEISQWWTEMLEGNPEAENGTFTVRFGDAVFKTTEVTALIPNERVVWSVVDSLIDLPTLEKKTEWIGTTIRWDIVPADTGTTVTLTHMGLTPEIGCFAICREGWKQFTDSLADHIQDRKGRPFQR